MKEFPLNCHHKEIYVYTCKFVGMIYICIYIYVCIYIHKIISPGNCGPEGPGAQRQGGGGEVHRDPAMGDVGNGHGCGSFQKAGALIGYMVSYLIGMTIG